MHQQCASLINKSTQIYLRMSLYVNLSFRNILLYYLTQRKVHLSIKIISQDRVFFKYDSNIKTQAPYTSGDASFRSLDNAYINLNQHCSRNSFDN